MPSLADQAIASPLNLLSEEEQAREVLLLSYTLNLEFWERYAQSVARGLGARVTIVGDAAMVSGDPAHVRYAGITYLDGRAACINGGAFHPKLLVIADEDYASVAIGSGNGTVPGWHDNAELWTVLRGDSASAPETFLELAGWLRALHERVLFTAAVRSALDRVAVLLEGLPATVPGPQLIASLERPIADQLPVVVADELVLAAPFHDRAGAGVQALLDRFRPSTPRLLLQPRDVVADGNVLASHLTRYGGAVESIASDRYYHGKLIEWTSAGRRFALTGSPNLSRAALLQTLANGGNCELALLSEIGESLAPPSGGQVADEDLAAIAFTPSDERLPAILLLGVMLGPDRIEVNLSRPLADVAALEFAVGAAWETVAPLPAGAQSIELEITLAPGTAVRVRQGTLVSNTCFIADPSRFNRTRVEHLGRVHTNEEDIFRDASVAEAFAQDLAELRQFLTHGLTGPGGTGDGGGTVGAPAFTSWEEYLDACEAHIGERLLAYGLALPALGSGEGMREEADASTLKETDAEDDGGVVEPDPEEEDLPLFDDVSAAQRRRYQRWCERLGELSPQLPYAGRLVALRLLLDAVRGGLFPRRDEWIALVATTTSALGAIGDAFDEERARAGSLAAVALAAMRGKLRRFADWEEPRFPYERAVAAVTPLLEHADADIIERYSGPLQTFFGPSVAPATVEALVESLLNPDPIADAVRLANDELHISVERDGNVIRLNDPIPGDPRRTLLTLIALCNEADVAVATPTWSSIQALAAWRKPELVIATRSAGGVHGALYELRGFGPGTYKDDIQGLPRPREMWSSSDGVPARSLMLLHALGVTAP